jgi:hypothetical protein
LRQPLGVRKKIAEHALQIRQHVIIPVTHDGDAPLGKPLRSPIVGAFAFSMLSAVDFDSEAEARAIEIDGVWSYGMLLPERETIELVAPQRAPQPQFRVGHVGAEGPCSCGHIFRAGKA